MIYPLYCARFFPEELSINPRELALRLSVPADYSDSSIDRAIDEVLSALDCRAVCTQAAACVQGDTVQIGDTLVNSRDLSKNLSDCNSAIVFAVTLGAGVDRLLRQKSVTGGASHFICDAVASAVAEAAADKCNEVFTEGKRCKPRFSAGYGDLPLSFQRDIIRILDAEKTAGITLSDTDLMIPQKSITAIIGILK